MKWTPARKAELARLWPDHSAADMARMLGSSKNYVWTIARQMGLPMERRKTRARPDLTERNALIRADYLAGDKLFVIAARYNLSKQRICSIAVTSCLPPRDGHGLRRRATIRPEVAALSADYALVSTTMGAPYAREWLRRELEPMLEAAE